MAGGFVRLRRQGAAKMVPCLIGASQVLEDATILRLPAVLDLRGFADAYSGVGASFGVTVGAA